MSNGYWPWNLKLGSGSNKTGANLPLLYSPLKGDFSGGGQYVQDFQQYLKTAGVDQPQFCGMRLATTVAEGALLGEIIISTSGIGDFAVYGNNPVIADGDYLKSTYVDSGYFIGTDPEFTTVANKTYLVTGEVKINTGSAIISPVGGVGYLTISNTTYEDFEFTFVANDTATRIIFSNAGSGEILWVHKNIVVREVIPQWLSTGDDATPNHPVISGVPQFIPNRQDSQAYSLGDQVNFGGMYWLCTTDGTTAASAPLIRDEDSTFPVVAIGGVVVDDTVVWTCQGHYQDLIGYKSNEARTNSALGSCSFGDGTYWTGNTSFTITEVNSIIDGQKAYKHTAASSASRTGGATVFTDGEIVTASIICEEVDAAELLLYFRNITDGTFLLRIKYVWATDILSKVGGSGEYSREILADNGPNGGRVVRLTASNTNQATDDGDTCGLYIYPVGGASTSVSAIIHHAQLELDASFASPPIITVDSTVTRAKTVYKVDSKKYLRGNDVAIQGVYIPEGFPAAAVYYFSIYASATNSLSVYGTGANFYVKKKVNGVNYSLACSINANLGKPYQWQLFFDSTIGLGTRVRVWDGLVWGAFTAWDIDSNAVDLVTSATYQLGSYAASDTSQFNGSIPYFRTKFTKSPKDWLIANPLY